MALPPITQESAWGQFRAQVLTAPKLNTFVYNHVTYTLSDVKESPELSYSAKDDDFDVFYDLVWQPAMPSGGPQGGSATLTNNGYGHYFGLVGFSSAESDNSQNAYVTIK